MGLIHFIWYCIPISSIFVYLFMERMLATMAQTAAWQMKPKLFSILDQIRWKMYSRRRMEHRICFHYCFLKRILLSMSNGVVYILAPFLIIYFLARFALTAAWQKISKLFSILDQIRWKMYSRKRVRYRTQFRYYFLKRILLW